MTELTMKARTFRNLSNGPVLVLPNAWDAASAAVIVRAGAPAIATTSGGVAWSLGRPDGQGLTRQEMADAVRRIAAAVDVPVTADLEGGYGPAPGDVAATVQAAIEAGAVGMNLEDSGAEGLFSPTDQADRIRAGREAAAAAGLPEFFLNARTDVFLRQAGDEHEVTARAELYAKAGADGLFVPGLVDVAVLGRLTAAVGLPVNAMAGPGGPGVAEFAAAGVKRVSVGTAIAQAAYGLAERAAREVLGAGTYSSFAEGVAYGDLNALTRR
ncbi:isocitrate lyase/phosphoenolpyruvate mutase family protein [Actinoplanes sp. TFC3]|uniref:isocitrate lyase/PEP mutase family protein n=1 Tax=Actinoplanes sp. TFC3 TaxID=1710355 RepID=UPI000A9C46D8|nr:isocitrate lyase/phosphoenolpyruvate mutase family protein [Actinoplanes sp. TFC3]